MTAPEGRISPLKRLAAQLAKALPSAWRFPICGVAASVSGREATQPFPPSAFARPDPRCLQPVADFLEPGHLSPLALVQSHLVAVPRGIAWARGAHLTADGSLIDPLSVGMNLSMDRWLVKRQRFFPTIRRVPGRVVSLSTDGHNNYYHWMLDLLPKLFIVLATGVTPDAFYLGASTPFQKQTLELLGISSNEILDANAIPFLQANEMIVPFLGDRHPPNVFNAGKCRLLVEVFAFLLADKMAPHSLPARFVVSRAKTRSRRVVNEAELLARLDPLGFQPVFLEDLTLVEQITLFARAEAIVASTGAGLVNLIHARPHVPVAILMPEACPDLVCRDIAAFAGLRCAVFHARPHPAGTPDRIGCDLLLDKPLLTDLVRHVSD
jgi:capsular polysaccharide biosynthesis protein